MHTPWTTPQSDNRALLFLNNSGLSWTVSATDKVTVVPVWRNRNFQTLISVPAVRPKRCHTLSNPAHRQDYTMACPNYTLQTMMPLPGWPVMAPNAYDNNNNGLNNSHGSAKSCSVGWIKQYCIQCALKMSECARNVRITTALTTITEQNFSDTSQLYYSRSILKVLRHHDSDINTTCIHTATVLYCWQPQPLSLTRSFPIPVGLINVPLPFVL